MAQSKDKSFPEKLKVFLKTFKGAGTSGSGSAGGGGKGGVFFSFLEIAGNSEELKIVGFLFAGPAKCRGEEQYLILTEEVEAELGPEAPLQTRLKAVKDLTLACKSRKAELVRSRVVKVKVKGRYSMVLIICFPCSTWLRRYGP